MLLVMQPHDMMYHFHNIHTCSTVHTSSCVHPQLIKKKKKPIAFKHFITCAKNLTITTGHLFIQFLLAQLNACDLSGTILPNYSKLKLQVYLTKHTVPCSNH